MHAGAVDATIRVGRVSDAVLAAQPGSVGRTSVAIMKKISPAGNTVAPAILALEALGFDVRIESSSAGDECRATRNDETYVASDPVEVLGLVKLVEVRGWTWSATDGELDDVCRRHAMLPR